ncbi:hypothetical protein [Alicyclobacillus shizuokensis]|uniref:hypothetical protein n=1 Tax=Alicyclobacillus shizuokensis TaxID=392014 RepID=UPI000829ED76|nr:hypothetical protein [Alicyclobacillus shizuokensis]
MNYTFEEHKAKKLITNPMIYETVAVRTTPLSQENLQRLTESAKGQVRKLRVQMEAIHVGRTANYNYYTAEGLKAGVHTWTQPYNKPVLTHHNSYDGEPIGRILKAQFSEATKSGRPGLIFDVELTDPDAIEKVLDGRYQTVSIGATTDKVTCNICGTDRTKEWCDHWPGESYDGQTAHFIIGTVLGHEVSYVNVPADAHAGNVSVTQEGEPSGSGDKTESTDFQVLQIAEKTYRITNAPHVNERSGSSAMNGQTSPTPVQTPAQPPQQQPVQESPTQTPASPTPEPQASVTQTPVQESELKAQLTEAANKIATLESTIANLVLEKQGLESKVAEMEAEHNQLVQENADLHAELHKMLAEKVLDLKIALRKPDVVSLDREEALKMHVERTKESLENTLQDLLAEMKSWRPEPGSVQNPGLAENEDGKTQKTTMTLAEAEDIFKGLFGGGRKRNN